MAMFVGGGRVAITATGVTDEKDLTPETDVMFVRRKMDFGTRQRVVGEAVKITESSKGAKRGRGKKKRGDQAELNVGAYQIALLRYNLLEWRGPSFVGVALTPTNIEQLDPEEPLVKEALDYIAEANATDSDDDGDEEGDDDPNVIEGSILSSPENSASKELIQLA